MNSKEPDTAESWARERAEYEQLAIYNSEVARGIQHTLEWRLKMVEIQARWNARYMK